MNNKYESDPNAGATIFVNLFILLLAFFVVLVALSEVVEERSDQAIESIAEVFSITVDATEETVTTPQNRASGISNNHILQIILTLIENEIKVIDPTIIENNANRVFVRFALNDIFHPDSTTIRAEQLLIIRRIAHSISQANTPIYVVVTLNTPVLELGSSFSYGTPKAAVRLEHLIDLLLYEGVPSYYLQGSISTEEDEFVEFRFYTNIEELPNIQIISTNTTTSEQQ
ncbi:MAG: flagellar motor protein MotB [Alphaproteobacteria bacterium]|nr:flagellar motor protein MotB [Alphaproteobacteria bacterium]